MAEKIRDVFFHAGILILLTIPFWVSNLDIAFSSLFYNKETGWYLFNDRMVNFLYKYGTYPAIFFSIFSILVITFRRFFKNKENLKKTAVVFLITLIFAPGIIINVLLKSYSGRPRPREIVEFTGKWEYRKVLQIGQPGRGYSFPCGHCSMGFIFCSIYFVIRNKRKFLANITLWFGLAYGVIIGLTRISQGAHFLSDVIWSGGITIIVSEIAYYLLFESEKNYIVDFLINRKISVTLSIVVSLVLILILFGFFLMSVPLYKEQKIDLNIKNKNLKFIFNGMGNLKINSVDERPYIFVSTSGFGFPRSNYYWEMDEKKNSVIYEILFNTFKKGFFKELSADISINLLKGKNNEIIINNIKGNIDYNLQGLSSKLILFTKNGDIFITVNGKIKQLFVKSLKGNIYLNLTKDAIIEPLSFIALNAMAGNVKITNNSNFIEELNESAKDIHGAKELYLRSKETGFLNLNINAKKIIVNNR